MTDFSIPTPTWLSIYHDSAEYQTNGYTSAGKYHLHQLTTLISHHPHVHLLTLDRLLSHLTTASFSPFAYTIGIGKEGETIARRIHEETGWFPTIDRLPLSRAEQGSGYVMNYHGSDAMQQKIRHLRVPSVAIVDDTIYSGRTIASVLSLLPVSQLAACRIFCLQGIADVCRQLMHTCPVTVGIMVEGKATEEASIIRFSGLYTPGAIVTESGEHLAFYQREQWLQAWFPRNHDQIRYHAEALHQLYNQKKLHI